MKLHTPLDRPGAEIGTLLCAFTQHGQGQPGSQMILPCARLPLAPTSPWGFFCCIHAVFYAIPQGMSEKVGLGLSPPLSAHPPVTPSLPHGAEGAVSLSIHSIDLPDLSTPCSPALQNAAFTGLQLS